MAVLTRRAAVLISIALCFMLFVIFSDLRWGALEVQPDVDGDLKVPSFIHPDVTPFAKRGGGGRRGNAAASRSKPKSQQQQQQKNKRNMNQQAEEDLRNVVAEGDDPLSDGGSAANAAQQNPEINDQADADYEAKVQQLRNERAVKNALVVVADASSSRDDDDDDAAAVTTTTTTTSATEALDNNNNNGRKIIRHQPEGVASSSSSSSSYSSSSTMNPLRRARLDAAEKLDPDVNEWPLEDPDTDGAINNVSTNNHRGSDEKKFISTLRWGGKCFYHVTNFCVVQGDLVLYHDPATSTESRKDSLRMCNEFSQRSPSIRLKYRSEPMPKTLPGPLLTKTPGWVLQFWCQDLFHSTLSIIPAFHTKKKYFPDPVEPDIYIRIARGKRKKGQYCHIKFGHPLSYNISKNKLWGQDKQFPFAGNPYWKMYRVLSKSPWRLHPLYRGATKKTACYKTGIIDKMYVKDVVRSQAREYSDAQIANLDVEKAKPRECGKYRLTIIDRRGKTRQLTNIPNIVEIGKRLGFTVVKAVRFEFLTLQEQIAQITATDLLLGMHGNGLTWQQFMQQGSCLIELCHTWYQPYAKLFGHSYFHSSIRHNPIYKKQGEYVPFAHNETEIEELLLKGKAALDRTSCGEVPTLKDDRLELMYSECAPHC